jgi:hypothetical protein
MARRVSAFVVVALVALVAPGPASAIESAPAGRTERLTPREPHRKPREVRIPQPWENRRVHVKFVEGSMVRLREGRLVTVGDDDMTGVDRVFRRYRGLRPQRLFERPERTLTVERLRFQQRSLRVLADLNLWFRIAVPEDTDARAVLRDLNALSLVEVAYPEPDPSPPPIPDDLTGEQGYRNAAPDGIDAIFANAVPGGTGANVSIIDIEYSWNQIHEDLPATTLFANQTPLDPFSDNNHGTSVLGELAAVANSFGVTGLVHGATIGLTNANNMEDGYDLADSINIAATNLTAGDAILLEQQVAGANGGCGVSQVGCVAVEWVQAYYDAIVSATSAGIIVVEAAGNGSEDLDGSEYGSPFPDGRADSGAIIVGAGAAPGCTSPAHSRLGFSTFGSRVNLHGWGECVMTTGYGFHSASVAADPNQWYRGTFGGTSSASPIVTSAAAILSSVAQQQGDANGLTSTEARTMLAVGATPQDTSSDTGNIGPMPNLGAALAAYLPSADAGGPYVTPEGTDVLLNATGSSDPQGGPLTYQWDFDYDGLTFTVDAAGATPLYTDVGRDKTRTLAVRVTDVGGAQDIGTASLTVTNVAPSVSIGSNAPKDEGSLVTVTGTATDPGWEDPLSATIDWGPGPPEAVTVDAEEHVRPDGTLEISATHIYGDDGTFPVEVCGSDDDTATCQTIDVHIDNVAPTVTIDPAQVMQLEEGESLDVRATFTDPGWEDTYTPSLGTGHLDAPVAAGPDLLETTEGGPGSPDEGEVTATITYGDNGTYTVTLGVTDDDSGTDDASFNVQVDSVDPTAVIDTSGATDVNGTPTIISNAGSPVDLSARSEDPGSDDLLLTWDLDDGPPAPDFLRPSLVNAPLMDPFPSPTFQPRDETDDRTHAFGEACLYDVVFSSFDDDGGSASDTVAVVITGNSGRSRSAGYWGHQYGTKGKVELTPTQLECYLGITGHMSTVFDEERDASTIPAARAVLADSGPDMRDILDRQLLAAWLNFANGGVSYDEMVDTDGDGVPDTAFADAVAAAEAVRLDPGATRAELEAQKNILERINLMHGG